MITQWNIRSINSNRDNLINMIRKTSPDIILLNETWLKPNYNFKITNYDIIRKDRNDGKGGIATLIRNNLIYEEIKLNHINPSDPCQILIIKIKELNVINIYNPPSNIIPLATINRIISGLTGQIVIMGDLNALSPLWGSKTTNLNGQNIQKLIDDFQLCILNDGSSTRLAPPGQTDNPLDITLTSSQTAIRSSWMVYDDCGCSDHYPTILIIKLTTKQIIKEKSRYFNNRATKKASWEKYTEIIGNNINNDENYSFANLRTIIDQAIEETIPLKQEKFNMKPGNIWWDDDCSVLIKQRKEALNEFKNHPTLQNYIKAKQIIAKTKRDFKYKKRTKFKIFCATLNRNTEITKIWNTIKKFNNQQNTRNNKGPNTQITEAILSNLAICNLQPDFSLTTLGLEPDLFSLYEMKNVLLGKKDTSTGLDNITYSMLLHLPDIALQKLLEIFNNLLRGNTIPLEMQKQLILAFLKKDKDPNDSTSYRPITLASCITKTLESMIKNRVDWHCEHNNIFNMLQTGFRKGMGVGNNVAFLSSYILQSFSNNETTIAVFLDIKNAYDNVNIQTLYRKLIESKLDPCIANLIYKLNTNRYLYMEDQEGKIHGPYITYKGIIQGSPLSPQLFNIYMASIYNQIPTYMTLLSYADDLVILVRGNDTNKMTTDLNKTLLDLNMWLQQHEMTLSLPKCQAIWFTKGKRNGTPPNININNNIIPYVSKTKYLGTIFTQHLKWDRQVEEMKIKASKNLNIIRAFCRTWWGADPVTLQVAYNGIIKSHLDYCSFILKPCAKATLNKLNTVQFMALRIITGCMKSTPTTALLAETAEINLDHRRKMLATKFILKMIGYEEHPLMTIVSNLKQFMENQQGYWRGKDPPYLVEALMLVQEDIEKINKTKIHPCYTVDYHTQIKPIQIIDLGMDKNDASNTQFLASTETLRQSHTLIYTDASKNKSKVGMGIHIPSMDLNFSSRLPDDINICKAEMVAINKACNICKEKKITNSIILSDSISAISKINNNKISIKSDHVLLETKKLIKKCEEDNIQIKLAWIPGHKEIKGNEKADTLAKIGRELNIPTPIPIHNLELIPKYQKSILTHYHNYWKNTTKTKWYRDIQDTFPAKPWYSKFPFTNRRHITTIIRMRTGHCATKSHLYRLGVTDSPMCDCGQVEDLNHIFLECPTKTVPNIDIYREIQITGINAPFNIKMVLRQLNTETMRILIAFLNLNNINL